MGENIGSISGASQPLRTETIQTAGIDSQHKEAIPNEVDAATQKNIMASLKKMVGGQVKSLFTKKPQEGHSLPDMISSNKTVSKYKEAAVNGLNIAKDITASVDTTNSEPISNTKKTELKAYAKSFYNESIPEKKKSAEKKKSPEKKSGLMKNMKLFFKKLGVAIGASSIGGVISSSRVVQSLAKSAITTNTRIKPEEILIKAGDKEEIKKWAEMMDELNEELTHATHSDSKAQAKLNEGLFSNVGEHSETSIKINRAKMTFITDKLNKVQDKKSSEYKFLKTMKKTFEIRIAIKENIQTSIGDSHKLGAKLINNINLDHINNPSQLVKDVVTALRDNTDGSLRFDLKEILSTPNPLRNILEGVLGEDGIKGIELLLTDEGISIASDILQIADPDLLLSFVENPLGTILENKELLSTVSENVFDNVVSLLNKPECGNLIISLSEGNVKPEDMQLLQDILPLAKEAFLEAGTPSQGHPSKASQVLARLAGHVSNRFETEKKEGVKQSISALTASLDTAVGSLKTVITMLDSSTADSRSDDAVSQSETRNVISEDNIPEAPSEVDNSWTGWVTGMTSAIISAPGEAINFMSVSGTQDYVDAGGRAILQVRDAAIDTANNLAKAGVDGANYVATAAVDGAKSTVTVPASMIGSSIIDSKVNKTLQPKVDGSTEPATEKPKISLNQEKLKELGTQALVLVCNFVSENPEVLDTMGGSVATMLVQAESVIGNPELSKDVKSKVMTRLLKDNLVTIGTALIESGEQRGDDMSKNVGKTISSVGEILGSELVSMTLSGFSVLSSDSIEGFVSLYHDNISKNVSKGLGRLDNPGQGKETKMVKKRGTMKQMTDYVVDSVSSIAIKQATNFVVNQGDTPLPIKEGGLVESFVNLISLGETVASARAVLREGAELLKQDVSTT
jgi:hypothetical protein